MNHLSKSHRNPNLTRRLKWRKFKQRFIISLLLIILLMVSKIAWNVLIILPENSQKPIDAVLVLGGSIRREIYASEVAKLYPNLPIIISSGSDAPCIFQIFEHQNVPMENVWLENCAKSTFDNFVFSVPLLLKKKAHKVLIVTSPTHLPRAKYLAKIHLGAQGMAITIDTAREKGVPGNRESALKTTLDVTRSLLWAFVAQVIHPHCSLVFNLPYIDWPAWEQNGYGCENQNQIKLRQNRKK